MFRVFAAVFVWLCVAGCSKIVPGQQESGVPISVVPVVQSVKSDGTKALINGAAELQQYPISLLGTAEFGNSVSAVFGNDVLSYNSTESKWSYGNNPKYWIPGAFYSFVAFCPYADVTDDAISEPVNSLSNGTVSFSNNALSINNYITGKGDGFDARSEDPLYSLVERDNTKENDYSQVVFQMDHILSCLEFNVRNATNEDIKWVDGISLSGIKYKSDLIINNSGYAFSKIYADTVKVVDSYFDGVNKGSNITVFLPKGMGTNVYERLFDCEYLTVLPQTVYGNKVELKFTVHYSNSESVSYTVNLGSMDSVVEWEVGRKYKYNLTISSQNIYFQVSEVPWEEHNVELK